MRLSLEEALKANAIFAFLIKQTKEYLKEQNLSKCETCNGTGLSTSKYRQHNKGVRYCWDGTAFCEECKGIGYKGLQKGAQIDTVHYVCRNCKGLGCEFCNEEGIVDWVGYVMRGENV